jgi:RimJ/RimL family protein N-acetyltransferase
MYRPHYDLESDPLRTAANALDNRARDLFGWTMTSVWTGKRVRLRAVEPEDWEHFWRFDEDSAAQRNGNMVLPPRSAEAQREWAKERALAKPEADTFVLAVESLDEGALIGSVSTHTTSIEAGRFGYGIALGGDYRRQGYASEAVRLVLAFMFRERRYHKCEAEAWSFNSASLAFHLAFGFTEEGRRRDHAFADGNYYDQVLFGMTAEEFAELYPARPAGEA